MSGISVSRSNVSHKPRQRSFSLTPNLPRMILVCFYLDKPYIISALQLRPLHAITKTRASSSHSRIDLVNVVFNLNGTFASLHDPFRRKRRSLNYNRHDFRHHRPGRMSFREKPLVHFDRNMLCLPKHGILCEELSRNLGNISVTQCSYFKASFHSSHLKRTFTSQRSQQTRHYYIVRVDNSFVFCCK